MTIDVQPTGPTFRRRTWLLCAALALGLLSGCSSVTAGRPSPSNRPTFTFHGGTPTAPVTTIDPTAVTTAQPTPTRRPAPPTNAPLTELHFFGMRTVGGYTPAMSLECYTFYPGARTVEIRHGAPPALSDIGTYQGDETSGWRIAWRSGRSSIVLVDGEDALKINGARVTQIESCKKV